MAASRGRAGPSPAQACGGSAGPTSGAGESLSGARGQPAEQQADGQLRATAWAARCRARRSRSRAGWGLPAAGKGPCPNDGGSLGSLASPRPGALRPGRGSRQQLQRAMTSQPRTSAPDASTDRMAGLAVGSAVKGPGGPAATPCGTPERARTASALTTSPWRRLARTWPAPAIQNPSDARGPRGSRASALPAQSVRTPARTARCPALS